jgi:hypothetical protein
MSLSRSLATLVVALTLTAGCTSALAAKHPSAAPTSRSYGQAITACAAWIRTHRNPAFDAYQIVGAGSGINTFGTDADRFAFDKCMNGNGYAIEDVKPGDLPVTSVPAPTPTPSAYPIAWSSFRTECLKTYSLAFCSCMFTKITERFSATELNQILATNDVVSFQPITTECTEIAGRTF